MEPSCAVDHHIEPADNTDRVLLYVYIQEAAQRPVHLRGESLESSFIRSAGQTRRMNANEIRAALLQSRTMRFEELSISAPDSQKIIDGIDIAPVCSRLKIPFSSEPERQSEILVNLKFAAKTAAGLLPTYLGTLVAGRDFKIIPGCEHYGIRLTRYKGAARLSEPDHDKFYLTGYVHSFDKIIDDIVSLLPKSEVIEKARRKQVPIYPEIALRELIANATCTQ